MYKYKNCQCYLIESLEFTERLNKKQECEKKDN